MAVPKPDYHFLYLSPGLPIDWLFGAARIYIFQFRPILINSLETPQFTPARKRIAVTTLARRDTAKRVSEEVAKRYPRAYDDALVYDFIEEMKMALDGRAELGQRLGQPETDQP